MRPFCAAAVAALAVAGCGGSDRTDRFVACLQEHGGTHITDPDRLHAVPFDRAHTDVGANLKGLSYVVMTLPGGGNGKAVAYVVTNPATTGAARPTNPDDVIEMPASADWTRPIEACAERAAPGEARP